MDYKDRHEQFVSGLVGGSVAEIYVVSCIIPVAFFAWWALYRIAPSSPLTDLFFNWLVPLASLTLYAGKPVLLLALIGLPAFAAFFLQGGTPETSGTRRGSKSESKEVKRGSKRDKKDKQEPKRELAETYLPQKPFLTVYRSSMLIVTAVAILAVDFRIFPRRFAKVETWGTSVMDLGVGSFVFSMGIVASRPALKAALSEQKQSFWWSLKAAFNHSLKVLALGVIRLAAVKLLGYQEHVTEYGIHWNFFMTLGLLPPVVAVLQQLAHLCHVPLLVLGGLVTLGYELVLKNTGLQEWVLSAPRTNVLAANKEGICSFFGYLAIFLMGQAIGFCLLPSKLPAKRFIWNPASAADLQRLHKNPRLLALRSLLAVSAVLHLLFAVFRLETEPSRRLANLPYVLWIVGYNCGYLAMFYGVWMLTEFEPSPSQLAVNRRGQTVFVLANILTGVVNMALPTIDMGRTQTMAVLAAYCAVLYIVAQRL